MAVDIEKLVVQMSADIKNYENAMRKAVNVTKAQVREIEDRYKKMGGVLSDSVAAPLAGLGAALSTREILRYADAWTTAGNLVRAASASAGVQTRSLEELRRGADAARVSLESYAGLYANLIRSASGVAKSEAEVARATDLVSKAMKAGGASVAAQEATIQQLGQALGAGVLQGDELSSLRENAPVIVAAIAKEFDTTVGKLKDLGEAGELTADRVFQGILKYAPEIEAQFAATNQTIADGFVKLGNALTEYIGTMAQSVGLTEAVNAILGALAGNLDSVAAAAAAAGVVLLSRYVPAMTRVAVSQGLVLATNPFLAIAAAAAGAAIAVSAFGDEIHPVAGEMANLQDYAGSVWDTVSAAATDAGAAISEVFLGTINAITEAIGGVPVTWEDVGRTIADIVNTWIGVHVAAFNTIKAVFQGLLPAVGDAVVSAANYVIEKIEWLINGASAALNVLIEGINNIPGVDLGLLNTNIDLGSLTNQYAGAGRDLGDAIGDGITEALNRDYLGDVFAGIRRGANIRALDRRSQDRDARDGQGPISTDGYGSLTRGADDDAGGGGGKKAKKAKKDELEKEIEQILKKTAALQAETAAQASLNPLVEDYGYTVAKATALQDLETAAKEAGIAVTDEQRATMERIAEVYARAVEESNRLTESQQALKESAEDWQDFSENMSKGFVQDLIEGKSAADALNNALGRIGDKLIDLAFDTMFDTKSGGLFSTIGSSLATAFGGARANGGPVTAGKAYLVGEKRPELFVPNQSGVILPRVPDARARDSSAQGGGLHVTFGVDADASGNLLPFVTDVADRRIGRAGPGVVRQSVQAVRTLNRESRSFLGG